MDFFLCFVFRFVVVLGFFDWCFFGFFCEEERLGVVVLLFPVPFLKSSSTGCLGEM